MAKYNHNRKQEILGTYFNYQTNKNNFFNKYECFIVIFAASRTTTKHQSQYAI